MAENKNDGMLPLTLVLLSLVAMGSITSALSGLGGRCALSGDCVEGYCLNHTCRYPPVLDLYQENGSCNLTADCARGFCRNKACIVPIRSEYEIISPGIKSGCAGIIDNCMGVFCAICDATWILMVVGAGIAAFVGRKRGRLLPVLLFLIPMFAGFIVFPLLGLILVMMEILILATFKAIRAMSNIKK